MHKSLEKFKPYVEKGLVREVISPCKRLVLYNYCDKCTYEKAWDEVTLNARGTVYEIETGKVVARAFPKFFNFGELDLATQQSVLSVKNFEVYEKMDGSLGIVYYYDGEWRVNTRGSFTSDQAIKAKELLDTKYNYGNLDSRLTYLVEIVYPENKIIVDYGDYEFLTLLAAYSHKDVPYLMLEDTERFTGIPLCNRRSFSSIEALQAHLETLSYDEEGYVVRLENGYRVKFKSAEYLRLARILSNMSPLAFWEKMENGKIDREFLEQLPEEFRDECDAIMVKLEDQYAELQQAIRYEYSSIAINLGPEFGESLDLDRKLLGLYLKEHGAIHQVAMFPMLLGQSLDKYIMKTIRPTGNVISI